MTQHGNTLITGASSGIGLHLAHEFARNGHPLFLVAPDEEELSQVAAQLTAEHGVTALAIAADLEEAAGAQNVFNRLQQEGAEVDILVNNAGHGQRGNFAEVDIATHLSIVALNVEAVLRMTALFLPPMLARRSGRILNTASIAGFEPGPTMAVYHASKAFVLSWSEALAVETEESGVTVTALCPGATDTDFFLKADAENTRAFQQSNLMAPQDVAKAGYEAAINGERIIIPGATNKAIIFARRVMTEHAMAHMNEKNYRDVPPDKRKRSRGVKENKAD